MSSSLENLKIGWRDISIADMETWLLAAERLPFGERSLSSLTFKSVDRRDAHQTERWHLIAAGLELGIDVKFVQYGGRHEEFDPLSVTTVMRMEMLTI